MTVDDLVEYGVERMDDDDIRAFLSSQGRGVLGLPTGGAPYLLPMSFDYDGDSRLYFTFVVGSGSRKRDLSESNEAASFLVYRADTAFTWESVRLAGRLERVPDEEVESIGETLENAWRPDLFERASTETATELYRFVVEEQTGIRNTGLPPEFDG
jgi:nitroimidazol reductase NimA-like FMN-containing flavoprotein (pyridoxamine 5'-phosphate oxidase superfamily)